jgi:hypothetical protein
MQQMSATSAFDSSLHLDTEHFLTKAFTPEDN